MERPAALLATMTATSAAMARRYGVSRSASRSRDRVRSRSVTFTDRSSCCSAATPRQVCSVNRHLLGRQQFAILGDGGQQVVMGADVGDRTSGEQGDPV